MKIQSHVVVTAVALLALSLTGCPGGGDGGIIDPGSNFATCEASDECPTGHVCSAGTCVIGDCDAALEPACDTGEVDSPYCCKPWELCSTLSFTCENDPNVHGIGCDPEDETCTACQLQEDCAAGQFCSGAACFDAAGREACTSSFQCPGGQRCDRTVFLCVPDKGGCTFCGPDFPELCCEDDQICSQESGFCQDVADPECEVSDDCNPGLQCDELKRCVQCVADTDCGPGLACDEGTGNCFSLASVCETDADCQGAKRCATARQECVIPECTSDADCRDDDSRTRCDVAQLACFLPPAVCTESDESNNSAGDATPMVGGVSYSGLLCRGDADFLSFPVNPGKRYTAIVDFGGSGQPGISVVMLDTTQVVESSAQFSGSQASVQVAGVTNAGETGDFYLKVTGSNADRDQWSYTVTIREDEPSQPADCTPAGQTEEPNNEFATATALVLGQTRTFSRCGTGDADFYKVGISSLHGVNVIIGGFFNAEGNINVELYKAPNTSSRVAQGTTINDVEVVNGPEGPSEYFLKVSLGSTAGAVSDQTYSITATEVARPAACTPDATEDDGTVANAAQLTLNPGVVVDTLIRCNPQDVDLFKFSMPPNLGGVVLLRFTHSEGDMALDLLDATGTQLVTSNVSNVNTDPDEQVTIPGSATDTIEYIARARLAGVSGGITGQHYTLEVQTFDNSQCIATEPSGGDDAFGAGRCIGVAGDYTDVDFPCAGFVAEPYTSPGLSACRAAPGTLGCGLVCGNDDSDWVRVGILDDDQVMHAVLTFDKTEGGLSLVRGTVNANNSISETTTTDSNNDGVVELTFTAPRNQPKEYGIRVKPAGTTGHQLQPYSLSVEVGLPCEDDTNDAGTAANEKPSTATPISRGAGNLDFTGNLSRCSNDVDVFELILLAGEDVTVEIDQADPTPGGLQAELALRPADLNVIPTSPVITAVAGAAPQTFNSAALQTVYITVRPPTGTVVTGPYTLHITTN